MTIKTTAYGNAILSRNAAQPLLTILSCIKESGRFQFHRISYYRPSHIRTYQQKSGRFSVFRSLILVTHASHSQSRIGEVTSRSNTTGARVIPLCRRFVTEIASYRTFNDQFSQFDYISLSYTIPSTLLKLLESASGGRPLSPRDRSSSTYSCRPLAAAVHANATSSETLS